MNKQKAAAFLRQLFYVPAPGRLSLVNALIRILVLVFVLVLIAVFHDFCSFFVFADVPRP